MVQIQVRLPYTVSMIYKFMLTISVPADPYAVIKAVIDSQIEMQANPPTGPTGPRWIKDAEGKTIGHWEVTDKQ